MRMEEIEAKIRLTDFQIMSELLDRHEDLESYKMRIYTQKRLSLGIAFLFIFDLSWDSL